MKFPKTLVQGRFLKRYKRFFADVDLDGKTVIAHVPNTGSLKSCNTPGSECLLSPVDDPERKLKFTLEAIKVDEHWVGVNTGWPNKLAVQVFKDHLLKHWESFDSYQTEVKINGQSRIDLALWNSKHTEVTKWKVEHFKKMQPVHFVEIKNVTLKEGTSALFPDAVTERGQKHIEELVRLIKKGFTAEILFIVQRSDVQQFEPAENIDPEYAKLLRKGMNDGLQVTALSFEISKSGIEFKKSLPIKM